MTDVVTPAFAPEFSAAFSKLGLDSTLLDNLTRLGYTEPTPVQREADRGNVASVLRADVSVALVPELVAACSVLVGSAVSLSLHAARAVPWAVAGGLALGLAIASRPTYIVCSAMFLVPALIRGSTAGWDRGRPRCRGRHSVVRARPPGRPSSSVHRDSAGVAQP